LKSISLVLLRWTHVCIICVYDDEVEDDGGGDGLFFLRVVGQPFNSERDIQKCIIYFWLFWQALNLTGQYFCVKSLTCKSSLIFTAVSTYTGNSRQQRNI